MSKPWNVSEFAAPEAVSPPEKAIAAQEPRRITVELVGDAAREFDELREKRGLTISQAVRQALSILRLVSDGRFQLILRDKENKDPDRIIVLA